MFARNVRTRGYDVAVQVKGEDVPGTALDEYTTHEPPELLGGPRKSLNLPIEQTPTWTLPPPSKWADVKEFGAEPATSRSGNPSQHEAFQKAVDSGKQVLYVSAGKYKITEPVLIRKSIRFVVGPGEPHCWAGDRGAFVIDESVGHTVVFDRIKFAGKELAIRDRSRGTVVLYGLGLTRYAGEGSGKVFIEDVATGRVSFGPRQRAWLRQLDAEGDNAPAYITANGARVWCLGMKTEKGNTVVRATNGARVEVLGLYAYHAGKTNPTAFAVEDSDLAVACFTFAGGAYRTTVAARRRGEERTLGKWGGPLLVCRAAR
jgi:hypothetical protein